MPLLQELSELSNEMAICNAVTSKASKIKIYDSVCTKRD